MKRWKKRREPGRLLPRIPDEVTLDLIAPKLSWGDCRRLSAVSRAWSRAIQSREVHDARVRLHSTETLLLLSYRRSRFSRAITVFSIRENRGYKLPPVPYPDGRLAPASSCVSLDGKIYALGGESLLVPTVSMIEPSNGVHVLDLAGGTKWERCASMIQPRVHFGCGVVDGKIYVFGGFGHKRAVCGSEVYDPKKDTWSAIKAMPRLRFDHQVATVGSELVVHGGKYFEWDGPGPWNEFEDSISEYWYPGPPNYLRHKVLGELCFPTCGSRALTYIIAFSAPKANSLEVYDAVKDEWTVVEFPGNGNESLSFMAEGKLHSISTYDVFVHDTETNSWKHLHSHSLFSARNELLSFEQISWPQSAVAVEDRLLIIVEGTDTTDKYPKACLLQGTGFGSANRKIEWERLPFTINFAYRDTEFTNYSMHPIQL